MEMGNSARHQINAKKNVVIAYLSVLANIGYNVDIFSSVMIQAFNEGLYHDVADVCAKIT